MIQEIRPAPPNLLLLHYHHIYSIFLQRALARVFSVLPISLHHNQASIVIVHWCLQLSISLDLNSVSAELVQQKVAIQTELKAYFWVTWKISLLDQINLISLMLKSKFVSLRQKQSPNFSLLKWKYYIKFNNL